MKRSSLHWNLDTIQIRLWKAFLDHVKMCANEHLLQQERASLSTTSHLWQNVSRPLCINRESQDNTLDTNMSESLPDLANVTLQTGSWTTSRNLSICELVSHTSVLNSKTCRYSLKRTVLRCQLAAVSNFFRNLRDQARPSPWNPHPINKQWRIASCWLLVASCCVLVVGCWLLVASC